MKRLHMLVVFCTMAILATPGSNRLDAAKPKKKPPIIVTIDDVAVGPPKVTVTNAPAGWDIYTGPLVANPAIEDGGIITLHGVDVFGHINPDDGGWRFVDPALPPHAHNNATDIVWIQHDWHGTGELQVGFNTREDGGYYINPEFSMMDDYAGTALNKWYTVYADAALVVQFNPRKP